MLGFALLFLVIVTTVGFLSTLGALEQEGTLLRLSRQGVRLGLGIARHPVAKRFGHFLHKLCLGGLVFQDVPHRLDVHLIVVVVLCCCR